MRTRTLAIAGLILNVHLWVLAAYAQDPWLKIGYVTDVSGRSSFFGAQGERGMAVAAKTLSDSHRSVAYVREDTKGLSAAAASAASKLLELHNVDAIVCDTTINCAALSSKVLAAKKPLIYHSPSESIARLNSHAHRNFIDYTEICAEAADYLTKQQLLPFGSMTAQAEFGELCIAGINRVNSNHFSYRYIPGDDLRSAVPLFKKQNIRAVIDIGYEGDVLNWFRYSREQRFNPVHVFPDFYLSERVSEEATALAQNHLVMGYKQVEEPFRKQLEKIAPGKENLALQVAALTYNATKILVNAFSECSDRAIDCIDKSIRSPQKGLLLGAHESDQFGISYPHSLYKFVDGKLVVVN